MDDNVHDASENMASESGCSEIGVFGGQDGTLLLEFSGIARHLVISDKGKVVKHGSAQCPWITRNGSKCWKDGLANRYVSATDRR